MFILCDTLIKQSHSEETNWSFLFLGLVINRHCIHLILGKHSENFMHRVNQRRLPVLRLLWYQCFSGFFLVLLWFASQVVQFVKNLPASEGDTRDLGSFPGSGRSPGIWNSTHSGILSWEIPWTKEPGEWAIVLGVTKSKTWLSN